ncbi:MAG: PD40 domain-containing protein [Vicinamibacteria bacterium]|nr:PD40 domain-containing protein [Vicinamibacteria bacterium]
MKSRSITSSTARAITVAFMGSLLCCSSAQAQFIPYYGKNKVKYDAFSWRIYRSPHFEIYYYPEFEQHLARIASYAESSYAKISRTLKHSLQSPIPLVLYKTHSEFEQTSIFPSFVPEGVQAFAEPTRARMVLPIDEAPDRLNGLIAHEMTHVFAFDLIPRGFMKAGVPLWVDEGLAEFIRGEWEPLDLMMIREAAVSDQVPRISRFEGYGNSGNARFVYNLGHAAFDFIEARFGKEGIRQFLYAMRKGVIDGSINNNIYEQSFKMEAREFDVAFEKWLMERFKPHRDKERPNDYGKDLSPDSEKTSFTQVFAFSPSPSGELIAALTGNRADGEADLVLLSARDGRVVRNLTGGYTDRYESITWSDGYVAGRSISFDPNGDHVAFFARTGKGRSLLLAPVTSRRRPKRIKIPLDLPQSPALLPDGRGVVFAGLKDGVSDLYLMDLKTHALTNLTRDDFRDSDPQVSPDGRLVAYTRRISGHDKIFAFPLADPSRKTQLTFGAHDDMAPSFSRDGKLIYFSSNEDDEILNIRSLDLTTGVIRQLTDALGGNCAPAILAGAEGDRVGFIAYSKGEFRLHAIDPDRTVREVDQSIDARQEESIDFEPDLVHHVITENKRGKRPFEKFVLESRPPIDVGVTSGGDFFGGSQIALADVLSEKSLVLTAMSEREFRSYFATFVDLSRRFYWGASVYDNTVWGYADPYGYYSYDYSYSRSGAVATRRVTGASLLGQYPLDKMRRLELSAGVERERDAYLNDEVKDFLQQQADALGVGLFLNNGTSLPLSLNFVSETTRFREFGPLEGSSIACGVLVAPGWGEMLSRVTLNVDLRRYLRLTPTTVFALRFHGFRSTGDNPDYFFYGGNMELRGYDYRIFSGNEGFFANAELRLPLIHVMATPIGLLGPVRGTVFAGVGGARWKDQKYVFGSSRSGYSYINDPVYGEPVSGFHLVNGRASYGLGFQVFMFGYPLHFDWSKLTDLKVVSNKSYFKFWIGYDF